MTESGCLVEIRSLSKAYGPVQALQGVDLSLPTGGIGLVGPNGAGKTTLLKILLGLLRPDRGEVRVLGGDPAREGARIRSRIGFVPEDDCYWEGLSAVGAAQFAGRLCGLSRREALKRAHETLDRIGLDEERYRPLETYSLGMRQKARMAQAVVHNPRLLIMDEPTRSLDPGARSSLIEWINQLRSEGMSILISSHELSDIEKMCDQIVILHAGKVHACGSISDLTGRSDLWEMQGVSPPEEILKSLIETGLQAEIFGGRVRFRSTDSHQDAILKQLGKMDLRIRGLYKIRRSLEDIIPRLPAFQKTQK